MDFEAGSLSTPLTIAVLLHPFFAMLLGVACVAFAGVRACVFTHYHSVSTDVAVFAFACFVAMAVAWFVHEFQ